MAFDLTENNRTQNMHGKIKINENDIEEDKPPSCYRFVKRRQFNMCQKRDFFFFANEFAIMVYISPWSKLHNHKMSECKPHVI